jgi:hypothetical protein
MFLYHIPTYRFVELPGLKKPNSNVPSLETKVVLPSSIRDSSNWVIVSIAVDN